MKYKIGDVVKVKKDYPYFDCIRNKVGSVISLKHCASSYTGIEFQVNFGGHACSGEGKDGYCYYIEVKFLSLDLTKLKLKKLLED